MSRKRRILIYTVAGAVALTCLGVTASLMLRRADQQAPVTAVRPPAPAVPSSHGPHGPTDGRKPQQLNTPSAIDSAAASRPDWPYAAHEGGTPALVAALAAPFAAHAANRTSTSGGPTPPSPAAAAASKASDANVSAQDTDTTPAGAIKKSTGFKDFWRPKPRGPGARPNTPGGWNSDPRPTSGGNG